MQDCNRCKSFVMPEKVAITARNRKRDSMRCMMEALPLDAIAAGSLSATKDLINGLRGLKPANPEMCLNAL